MHSILRMGNSQKKSKILLLMWGITYITNITIFFFFCPVEGGLPILFSYKYGPSPLFFINTVMDKSKWTAEKK